MKGTVRWFVRSGCLALFLVAAWESGVEAASVSTVIPTLQHLRQQEGGLLQTAQALEPQPDIVPQPVDTLPEINVTANRRESPTFETPESLSIISREEILSLSPLAQNLAGLLRVVPGVQAGLGTSPLESNISIRGLGDDRSPVFIDGERQNVSQGEIREDLFSLDPWNIERIEVLRGSASGTYGSDATGGLVNVITRQPGVDAPPRVEFQGYFGGPSTQHEGVRFSTGAQNFSLALGANYHSTGDARDAFGGLIPNQQDYQTYNAQFNQFLDPDNRLTFKYGAYRYHSALLAISELPEVFAGLPLVSKDRYGIDWRSKHIFGSSTNLKLSVFYNQLFQSFTQQVFEFEEEEDGEIEREEVFNNRSTIRVNTVGTNLQLTTPVGEGTLTYGFDYYHEMGFNSVLTKAGDGEDAASTLPITPDGRQTGIGGYTFIDYPLTQQLFLSTGVRYDSYTSEGLPVNAFYGSETGFNGRSITDSAVTPKAGLTWSFAPNFRVRANYSQGFRVPTLKERFFQGYAGPLNAEVEDISIGGEAPAFIVLQGNPNLSIERTNSYEVGIGGSFGSTSFDLVYFYNQVSGLLNASQVGTDEQGVPIFQFGNIQNARTQGIETQGIWQIAPEWRLRGAFTWTDAIDTATNEQLDSVIPTYGTLQLRYGTPTGVFALLQGRAASARTGASGYGILDLNIVVPVRAGLQLTFTATNLTNSFYRESLIGFNAPGTQFFVGLRSSGDE